GSSASWSWRASPTRPDFEVLLLSLGRFGRLRSRNKWPNKQEETRPCGGARLVSLRDDADSGSAGSDYRLRVNLAIRSGLRFGSQVRTLTYVAHFMFQCGSV